MKRTQKIIVIASAIIVLLVGSLLALPYLFKDRIIEMVKEEVNNNLNAKVDFNDNVSLSLLKHFPNLSVGVNNIVVEGLGAFEGDTLLSVGSMKLNLNFKEFYFNNKAVVTGLSLKHPELHLVARDTLYNWDVLLESDDTSGELSPGSDFEKIIIQDGRFRYTDSLSEILVDIQDIDATLKGTFYNDIFDCVTNFTTSHVVVSYENIPYIDGLSIHGDATVAADIERYAYTFKENQFYAGDLLIKMDGGIKYINDDDLDFDLHFKSSDEKFKAFLSLIPTLYRNDLPEFNADGLAGIEASFKGVYSDSLFPAYHLDLKVKDGSLSYQANAEPLKNINLALNISCPDGEFDHAVVDLKHLKFSLKNEPFTTRMLLKTIESDPFIDASVQGKIHLRDFAEFIPKDAGILMQGDISADAAFRGNYSATQNPRGDNFSASGNLSASNIAYKSSAYPEQINVSKAQLTFNNRSLSLPLLTLSAGKSDLNLHGSLQNYIGYLLNDETLTGSMVLTSELLRTSDFMVEEAPIDSKSATKSTTTSNIVVIPNNLDIEIEANINHLEHDSYKLDQAMAKIKASNAEVKIHQLSTRYLGGHISLSGIYNTVNKDNPLADLSLTAQDIDIATIFKSFGTIRILAPIAEYAQGKFSTTFKVNTRLLPDFSPDFSQMTCSGILDLFNCDITGLKAVNQLASKLNYEHFAKPVKIADLLLSFNIVNGTVSVNPFSLPIGETNLNLGGSTSLDKQINFKGLLTIPKKLYEANAASYNKYIPANKLVDVKNLDYRDLLFDIDIVGTFLKPEVKLRFQNIKKGLMDEVKDRAKDALNDRKDEATKKAQEEFEQAKAEADKARAEAEEAVKKALEEEKRRIREQLEKEKEAARKKLEEEIRKKTGGLIKKPG